ncbi:hypothetical protein [Halorubrum distributum]|uniref:hypothetical protein n=1 Tax=Halorubrum distributum TaxID=29283 RepID=UPI001872E815|nr:hypothetical protein [Halorubrum distributum]
MANALNVRLGFFDRSILGDKPVELEVLLVDRHGSAPVAVNETFEAHRPSQARWFT